MCLGPIFLAPGLIAQPGQMTCECFYARKWYSYLTTKRSRRKVLANQEEYYHRHAWLGEVNFTAEVSITSRTQSLWKTGGPRGIMYYVSVFCSPVPRAIEKLIINFLEWHFPMTLPFHYFNNLIARHRRGFVKGLP